MSKTNFDTTDFPTHGCARCGRKDRPQKNGICADDSCFKVRDGTRANMLARVLYATEEALAAEVAAHAETKVLVTRLRDSNEHWQHSRRIWHRCKGGKIRHYPAVVCSTCMPGEGQNFDAVKEFQRLQAIADRPPKTKDGVAIAPEMILYCPSGHECAWWQYEFEVAGCNECKPVGDPGDTAGETKEYKLSDCFSTQAAAEAAKETT